MIVLFGRVCYYLFWHRKFMRQMFSAVSRCVGMADEADSKSVGGNVVRVQVPSPAVPVRFLLKKKKPDFSVSEILRCDGYVPG